MVLLQSLDNDGLVHIRLTTRSTSVPNLVRYNFKRCAYVPITSRHHDHDHLLHLLTIPSLVVHRDDSNYYSLTDLALKYTSSASLLKTNATTKGVGSDGESDSSSEGDLVLWKVKKVQKVEEEITPEKLAELDAQTNPFNFSERVSQTTRYKFKTTGMQTDPPPSHQFSANATNSTIREAYWSQHCDHHEDNTITHELQHHHEDSHCRPKKLKSAAHLVLSVVPQRSEWEADEMMCYTARREFGIKASLDLPGLHKAALTIERMLNQNIFDDIAQDFMYWDDEGDDYHPDEGSLLPLWRFPCESSRTMTVTEVCWSLVYSDLFAVAYTDGEASVGEGSGLVCLYSLKNPNTPERSFPSPCGVTSVHLHPTLGNLVVAGWCDGTVVVYDVRSRDSPVSVYTNPASGKHLLPVTRVRWVENKGEKSLRLYSVALDGQLTQWQVVGGALLPQLTITLPPCHYVNNEMDTLTPPHNHNNTDTANTLTPPHERGTCLALKVDLSELVVGLDSGWVYQFTTACLSTALASYPAHSAPVMDLAWNHHHSRVFISCSLDWTIKLWLQECPFVTLDLGSAVSSVAWARYSSSVFVAATEEGRVHVYDLFYLSCRPLCRQRVLQHRHVTVSCLAINPSHPIIIVGGHRGYVLALKLSPNLRKMYTVPRGAEEIPPREMELRKMERIIGQSGASVAVFDVPQKDDQGDSNTDD
ncbi:hypothetical protein Pmani_021898 [Petrolisthes manimaculis]|uniref:Uncharacterized protein n=1 Tax=Petrolisthes manimaculis TaxID=1843537 RepID=A0AAE1U2N7_9EUCA|nr:hypothetical protein Pmani_021898 [Petrolisthes manimaculis]